MMARQGVGATPGPNVPNWREIKVTKISSNDDDDSNSWGHLDMNRKSPKRFGEN